MGKKQEALAKIFRHCQRRGDFVFDNDLVRKICEEVGFKNHFDVTKVDKSTLYPDVMQQGQGHFIIHLGGGRHQIVPNASFGYHQLEAIDETECVPWGYRPSLLNEFDTSESNILSVALNQRTLHHFLYDNIDVDPRLYLPRRTKISGQYTIDSRPITVTNLQMEFDAILELDNVITIIEGKNRFSNDFAVYQLFHPYLYFDDLQRSGTLDIKGIQCCYFQRRKRPSGSILRLHLYRFHERELSSIELLRKREYRLQKKYLL